MHVRREPCREPCREPRLELCREPLVPAALSDPQPWAASPALALVLLPALRQGAPSRHPLSPHGSLPITLLPPRVRAHHLPSLGQCAMLCRGAVLPGGPSCCHPHPWGSNLAPALAGAHTGAVGAHAGVVSAHTVAVCAHACVVGAHAGAVGAHDGAVGAHAGAVCATLEPCVLTPERCVLMPVRWVLTPVRWVLTPELCVLMPVQCTLTPVQRVLTPELCVLTPAQCTLTPVRCVLQEAVAVAGHRGHSPARRSPRPGTIVGVNTRSRPRSTDTSRALPGQSL